MSRRSLPGSGSIDSTSLINASFAGGLLVYISCLNGIEGSFLSIFIIGSCITAFGVVPLMVGCLEFLPTCSEKSPLILICPAFAVSAVANIIVTLAPFQQRAIILMALPLIAGTILWLSQRRATIVEEGRPATERSRARYSGPSLVLLAVGVFTYGFVTMFVWSVGIRVENLSLWDEATITRSLGILGAGVVLLAIETLLTKHGRSMLNSSINRSILATMLIGISLSALFSSEAPALSGAIADIGTAFFQIALFSYVIWAARVFRVPVARSLGFLFGTMSAAQVLSCLIAPRVLSNFFVHSNPTSIILLCLMVLVPIALIVFIPFDTQNTEVPETDMKEDAGPNARARYLADRFGLTPRETEVAELLLSGRSLPYIQDKLFISAGTAKTHLSHIYDKTQVHSRQDLLDLAESYLSHDAET